MPGLSVAGKREGLSGERSGLFIEAVRIIKEMRNATNELSMRGADVDIRFRTKPSTAIWENVPGAFSSGTPKGGDFRCVLEELARVKDPEISIPMPNKGKWMLSGCIRGTDWSIAWRTHDAQWWGVPQRRRRISVLARFDDTDADEILFKLLGETDNPESEQTLTDTRTESRPEVQPISDRMSRNPEESGVEGEETSRPIGEDVEDSIRAISFQERAGKPGGGKGILIQNEHVGSMGTSPNQYVVNDDSCFCVDQGGGKSGANVTDNVSPTLATTHGGEPAICESKVYGIGSYDSNGMKSANPNSGIYEAETSRTLDNNGGNPACNQGGMMVVEKCLNPWDVQSKHIQPENGIAEALYSGECRGGGGESYVMDSHAVCIGNGQVHDAISPSDEVSKTLNCLVDPMKVLVEPKCVGNGQLAQARLQDTVGTLNCMHDQQAVLAPIVEGLDCYNQSSTGDVSKPLTNSATDSDHIPCVAIDRAAFNQGQNAQYNFSVEEELAQTLVAKGPGGVMQTTEEDDVQDIQENSSCP